MNVPILKGAISMTNKEKLIKYIHNLTAEEADTILAYLTQVQTPEAFAPLLPHCSSLHEQEVVS